MEHSEFETTSFSQEWRPLEVFKPRSRRNGHQRNALDFVLENVEAAAFLGFVRTRNKPKTIFLIENTEDKNYRVLRIFFPILKNDTKSFKCSACAESSSAPAAISSDAAAFC
jgi:hypothetical protein